VTKELNISDILADHLEPGETPADYIRDLADQFEESEELLCGPTDLRVSALASL
jgi:hypothetical protein